LPFSLSDSPAVAYDPGPVGPVIRINCGGAEEGEFVGDAFVQGGSTGRRALTVDTTAPQAAPGAVYQSGRQGEFTYTLPLPALPAGRAYTLRLHFAEDSDEYAGKRRQNVRLNGRSILEDFDSFAEAGGRNKAVVKEFAGLQPDAQGSLVLAFAAAPDSPDQNAAISAIEVLAE
jgi:hypothetical protein